MSTAQSGGIWLFAESGPFQAPFAQLDWPRPATRRALLQSQVSRGPSTVDYIWRGLLTNQAAKPLSQQPDQVINQIILGVVAPVVAPFASSDWPQASYLRRLAHSDILVDLLPLQAGVVNTFGQDDWPGAARARLTGLADQFVNRLALTTIIIAGDPFIAPAWMLPQSTRRGGNAWQPDQFLPLHGGAGTVTSQGGSGINTLPHGAAAVATDRSAGNVATDRGANTTATGRDANMTATDRPANTTATPRP